MYRRFMKKRFALALSAVAVLAFAGGAYAYFTSTGSTTANATVGTATNWGVTTSASSGGPLYPDSASNVTQGANGAPSAGSGGNVVTIPYTVKNPSKGAQSLSNVAVSINPASLPTGCSVNDFSVDGAAVGATNNDTSLNGTYTAGQSKSGNATIEMIDNGAKQDACQSASPQLVIAAS